MSRLRGVLMGFFSLILAAAAGNPLLAQDVAVTSTRASTSPQAAAFQHEMQAALIYKIGRFVRWPAGTFAGSGGTLRLCVAGADEPGPASTSSVATS